ncbi:hypothetical protein RYA05_02235 [Pseudomonas syringae pv. actinidiae]|nr:hypothetical protein [Pseudomonas syringae pv. actinidiae]
MNTPISNALTENKNSVVSFLEKSGESIGFGALGKKMAGILDLSFASNDAPGNKSSWYMAAVMSVVTSATDAIKGFFTKEKSPNDYPFPEMQAISSGPAAPVKDLLRELNITSNDLDQSTGRDLLKVLNISSTSPRDMTSAEIMRDLNIGANDMNDVMNKEVQKTSMQSRMSDGLRL